LYIFLVCILLLAAAAGCCNNAGIKSHFYVWEVLFDAKTLLLAALFFILLKPEDWKKSSRDRGVFTWSLLKAIGAFLISVIVSGATLGIGLVFKKIAFADPENAATLVLTMLFDIPAVFIFSVTTVFVEEYVFRGCLLSNFLDDGRPVTGLAVSSLLWALYAIVEVLPLDDFSWITIGALILYYVAVGIAASSLYRASRSLWVSYAFRIGVMTVTPFVLSGVTGVTNAFFSTENIFFYSDGIFASTLLIVVFSTIFFVSGKKWITGGNTVRT
jgi:membrane protease YdiL (CAAX protease family)